MVPRPIDIFSKLCRSGKNTESPDGVQPLTIRKEDFALVLSKLRHRLLDSSIGSIGFARPSL